MNRCRMNNSNACTCNNQRQCECQRVAQTSVNVANVEDEKCSCGFNDPMVFPENYMYGQSYVPIQYISTTFKPEVGLKMGTVFPELVSPYEPCQSMKENAYLRTATANVGKCPNAR